VTVTVDEIPECYNSALKQAGMHESPLPCVGGGKMDLGFPEYGGWPGGVHSLLYFAYTCVPSGPIYLLGGVFSLQKNL
jgi:hypothetical protein